MSALDDLAKAPPKRHLLQPIINIPKPVMDAGSGFMHALGMVGDMSREVAANPHELLDLLNPLSSQHGAAVNHAYDTTFGGNQANNDENMTRIRSGMGIEQWYQHLPHAAQGTIDTVLQMGLDPTTLAGGSGTIKAGVKTIGEGALPTVMQAFAHLVQHAPPSARGALEKLGEDAAKVHNVTTGGGQPVAHMFRSLAQKDGAKGVEQGKRVLAAMTAQGAHQTALTQTLDAFLKPFEHLSKDEQTQVLRAIHTGGVDKLPDNLKAAAQSYKTMTDSRFWLNGGKEVRRRLTAQGFTLPEPLKTFDKGPLGIARASNYRKNYLTLPHDLEPQEASSFAQRHGRNLGKISDANLKARASNEARILNKPDIYLDAARSANAGAARAGSRMVLRRNLTDMFGGAAKASLIKKNAGTIVPEGSSGLSSVERQLLTNRAAQAGKLRVGQAGFKTAVPQAVRGALKSADKKEPALNIIGAMQKAGDIGKGSIFIQPTGHQRNIGTLLAMMNPTAIPGALKNFADIKFGFASPEEEYAKLGSAATSGAIGRDLESTPFRDMLNNLGKPGKALGKVYGASSKLLWGFDKAAKKSAFDWDLKETKDPLLSGFNVGKQMVNYENASPLAENLRMVAPFARWRIGMPLAIGKSIAEHPERALFLNRATGGAISGQPVQTPWGEYKSINPLSEVNAGAGHYARGSASATLRGLTYPDPMQYWLHSLPGVYQASPPNPYNIPETAGDKTVFQLTGLSKQQPKKKTNSGSSALDALMKP